MTLPSLGQRQVTPPELSSGVLSARAFSAGFGAGVNGFGGTAVSIAGFGGAASAMAFTGGGATGTAAFGTSTGALVASAAANGVVGGASSNADEADDGLG